MKVTRQTEPMMRNDYWASLAKEPCLERLAKPCHDCAVTTGFYKEMADDLLEQPKSMQDDVLKTWFCHNHGNKSCCGAYDYITNTRRTTEWK